MTALEKLAIERPEDIDDTCWGGTIRCMTSVKYLPLPDGCSKGAIQPSVERCRDCWNREIPEKTEIINSFGENVAHDPITNDEFRAIVEEVYALNPEISDAAMKEAVEDLKRGLAREKEKENNKMGYKVFEHTDEATCDMDYKTEYAKLEALVHQKDVALLESMNHVRELEKNIERLTSERNMYRYGLHVAEAFLGRKILEE